MVPVNDFLDRISEAFISMTSNPSSAQTKCAVVVLPTPGPPIIKHAPDSQPSSDAFFGFGLWFRFSVFLYLQRAGDGARGGIPLMSEVDAACQAHPPPSGRVEMAALDTTDQFSSQVRSLLAGLLAPACPATNFDDVGAYLTDHSIPEVSLERPGVPLYLWICDAQVCEHAESAVTTFEPIKVFKVEDRSRFVGALGNRRSFCSRCSSSTACWRLNPSLLGGSRHCYFFGFHLGLPKNRNLSAWLVEDTIISNASGREDAQLSSPWRP